MNDDFEPDRRRFIVTLAFTIASSAIHLPGFDKPDYITWSPDEVDWDEVIDEVLTSRLRRNSGVYPASRGFPLGSPWWCMEQALAEYYGGE